MSGPALGTGSQQRRCARFLPSLELAVGVSACMHTHECVHGCARVCMRVHVCIHVCALGRVRSRTGMGGTGRRYIQLRAFIPRETLSPEFCSPSFASGFACSLPPHPYLRQEREKHRLLEAAQEAPDARAEAALRMRCCGSNLAG